MHSKGKGRSGSSRPHSDSPPEWSNSQKEEVEEIISQLSKEGNSSAMIGMILRDKHGVPDARLVTGERISKTISRLNEGSNYPEDLMSLMRRALRLIDHLSQNGKDLHNSRQLELCESKIRRLSKYYKRTKQLDSDWTYKRDQLRLMVE
ncbi:MAG: 30S ribosomal protein S15 [Candidatus Thalassarchaeaceae archaeon]|jgi:small subunit ribosomal protein S15|nr:30S ribosomal protein S15 [Candidatus Thalassarchaeaceae archaeon]